MSKIEESNTIEAIIFAAGNRIALARIAQLAQLPESKVEKILQNLKEKYDSDDSPFRITDMGEDWKFTVKSAYVPIVEQIAPDTELTRSVVETLAILAWKAPVLQADLIKIRGASAYDHIGELQDRGFIIKEKEGRSYIIKLTPKFFEYFDVDKSRISDMFSQYEGEEKVKEEQVDEFVKKQEARFEKELAEFEEKPSLDQIRAEEHASQKDFFDGIEKDLSEATKRSATVISELKDLKEKGTQIEPLSSSTVGEQLPESQSDESVQDDSQTDESDEEQPPKKQPGE